LRLFDMFGWKERRALQLLNEHLDSVVKIVEDLNSLIRTIAEEKAEPNIIDVKIEMLAIQESFADDAHLKSLVTICNGAFFSGLREDFINLFNSIDDIADFAKDASQILARSELSEAIKRYYANDEASLSQFLDKILTAVKVLRETTSELQRDVSKVVENAIHIKELEEEADDIKWKMLRVIFSHKSEMDVLTLLELKEFLLTLDEIADAAAHSSEILITIVTKARA